MVTVKVVWKRSGEPARNQKVAVGFDGWDRGVTRGEYTDRSGEAHFDVKPGRGCVFVSGDSKYEGYVEGRIVVYI